MEDENKNAEELVEEVKTEKSIDNNPDKFNFSKVTEKFKKNPWILISIVLAIVVVIMLFRGGITGNVIGGADAGEILIDYLNKQTGGGVEYVSHNDIGNLYEVIVSYQGQEIPVYITKDGEYFLQGAVPLTGNAVDDTPTQQTTEVPKSDKPEVELFVWSYCPYGVQAQGPLAEVASLLGDNADFEGVLYYDGHGAYETQQNKIQACIQEVAQDKYWQYATGFVDDIYDKCGASRDIECDKTESIKLMESLGIDDSAVMSCVESKGDNLIAEHSARAQAYGVTGSPSLVINGIKVNVGRNAEAYKIAVCSAFNNAPEGCGEALSSEAAASAGSC